VGLSHRLIAGAALAAALAASASAAAQNTAPVAGTAATVDQVELAEARAVIDIMYPPAERMKMFDTLLINLNEQIRGSMPLDAIKDAGLKAIVDDHLGGLAAREAPVLQKHAPALLEAMAVAYTNEFTLAELHDIRAFAQTPSGGRYLSRAAFIVADPAIAVANTTMMTEAYELAGTMRNELQQKIVAYLTEHPEVAEQLASEAMQQP
jgi:hypothetical protein